MRRSDRSLRTFPGRGTLRNLLCLLSLGLLLLLSACASLQPQDDRLPVPPGTGERLLAEWAVQAGRYHSLRGLAKVKVKTPQRNVSGTQVVLAERPDRLRAETLGTFGTPLLLLATDGTDLGVLVPSQNSYYFGKANADNIGRFTRIPVAVDTLVKTLLYSAPVFAYDDVNAWMLNDGGWLLELSSGSNRQEMVFDARRRLVETRYFNSGKLILEVAYAEFQGKDSEFPHRFDMNLVEYDIQASLEFSELETNQDLLPDLFRLKPPAGVEMHDLDVDSRGS